MTGKWIWLKDEPSTENERGCFTEVLFLEDKAEKVQLRISADTRYIAYLNGEEIGRGPIRSTTDNWFFDEYDITYPLKIGSNLLAVRVWNYGWSTYQSLASAGGLVYEVCQGGRMLALSGTHTKGRRDTGHRYNTVKRNVNLGFSDFYDARCLDFRWVEEAGLSAGWDSAEVIEDRWGDLKKRPIKPFHSELKRPGRVVEFAEVDKGCRQVSLNTRKAFFGDRRDANESIFAGFIGCIVDSPGDMDGSLAFPNRTWNGIIGDFKIDGQLYEVDNSHREIPVRFKKGRQLLLLQVSGKYDDLYCHMEFRFPEEIEFRLPEDKSKSPFFVMGPTGSITPLIDGYSMVYGGLSEYNRMEEYTDLHHRIFSCGSWEELLGFRDGMTEIEPCYVFFDEYIYSLVRNEKYVRKYPVDDSLGGILWDNHLPTVIHKPSAGDYRRLIVDFGDIYVGSLEFALHAAEGTILDIYCFENRFEGEIDYTVGLNNSVRYICSGGYQSYKCMARMGCRYAAIIVRNQTGDVEIQSFGIRHSTYAPSNIGTFRCSDELVNKIWDMSKQTHLLCMEDSFTDCPTYEQAFWIGDAQISACVNSFIYGEYELIRHNLRLATAALKNSPLMNALAPTDWNTAIPMWMMNWIISIEFYVRITGDREIIRELYPQIKETLDYYAGFINRDGAFVIHAWNMLDWADMDIHNHGVVTGQQAVLAHCFKISSGFAKELGQMDDAAGFMAANRKLLKYIDCYLWDEERKMFTDGWSPEIGYSKTVSIQTHTLLLLFDGVVSSGKRQLVERYLENPPSCFLKVGSPFILFYLYEVWANSGKTGKLLEDMKMRWREMRRYDSTTCWEVFPGFYEVNRTRSYCHSWSSSPAYFLSRYVLGIHGMEEGFSTIRLSIPDTKLEWCEGSIPTPYGAVDVRWSKENGICSCHIALPHEIRIETEEDFDWKLTLERYDR